MRRSRSGGKLLEGLRSDPLTDFVPVVLLASTQGDARTSTPPAWTSEGADVRLGRPFESAPIAARARSHHRHLGGNHQWLGGHG